MTARQIIVPGAQPSRDANGRNLPAKLRFYMPGTSIPATVYENSGLTIPHDFPIISDSAGRFPQIWAEESTYFDVAWSTLAEDAFIATFEDVRPLSDAVLSAVTQAEAAADSAMQSAAEAAQTLADTIIYVTEIGDLSQALIVASAAAVTATGAAISASNSAAAAAISAASIDTTQLQGTSLSFAVCMGALL